MAGWRRPDTRTAAYSGTIPAGFPDSGRRTRGPIRRSPDGKRRFRVVVNGISIGKATRCRHLAALVIVSLLLLPACVGGGDGNENVTAPGGTVIPPPAGNEPDPGVADIREEFLAAVNQARSVTRMCGTATYGPAQPVAWSDSLAMSSEWNGFFSHTGSDGSSAGVRISRQGYPWTAYGENIAVGYSTASSVIQGWLGSEGHCRNLMSPAFTEIGAGYAVGPFGGSPSARYWTLDLADR